MLHHECAVSSIHCIIRMYPMQRGHNGFLRWCLCVVRSLAWQVVVCETIPIDNVVSMEHAVGPCGYLYSAYLQQLYKLWTPGLQDLQSHDAALCSSQERSKPLVKTLIRPRIDTDWHYDSFAVKMRENKHWCHCSRLRHSICFTVECCWSPLPPSHGLTPSPSSKRHMLNKSLTALQYSCMLPGFIQRGGGGGGGTHPMGCPQTPPTRVQASLASHMGQFTCSKRSLHTSPSKKSCVKPWLHSTETVTCILGHCMSSF